MAIFVNTRNICIKFCHSSSADVDKFCVYASKL